MRLLSKLIDSILGFVAFIVDIVLNHSLGGQALKSGQAAERLGLSSRQVRVLGLMAQDIPDEEIASQLKIDNGTLDADIEGKFAKLSATDRTRAVAAAIREGIVSH